MTTHATHALGRPMKCTIVDGELQTKGLEVGDGRGIRACMETVYSGNAVELVS